MVSTGNQHSPRPENRVRALPLDLSKLRVRPTTVNDLRELLKRLLLLWLICLLQIMLFLVVRLVLNFTRGAP